MLLYVDDEDDDDDGYELELERWFNITHVYVSTDAQAQHTFEVGTT